MSTQRFSLFASVIAATLALSHGISEAQQRLVVADGGGKSSEMLRKYFYAPFEKETGARVISVATGQAERLAKVKAMTQQGRMEWDMVVTTDYLIPSLRDQLLDLGQACEKTASVAKLGLPDACQRYGVIQATYCLCLAFRTDAGREPPKSWKDFFDTQTFPGERLFPNQFPWENLAIALVADGVDPNKTFPLDFDRAFSKLDKLKKNISVWWRTGDESQRVMRNRDAIYAAMWDGRVGPLKEDGVPISFTWNEAIPQRTIWSVLKASPNHDLALKFIDFYMTRPEAHLAYGKEMALITSSREAAELMPAEHRKFTAANPEFQNNRISVDYDWVIANLDEINSRWHNWIAK